MAGKDHHVVGQCAQPAERGEEVDCALARFDGEIRPGSIADEETVAAQHQLVVDHEGAVLGPVPRSVQGPDAERAKLELITVLERLVLELGRDQAMDVNRGAGGCREATVSGDVIEANTALANTPEIINTDPHGAGWLIKIKLSNPAEVSGLMDAAAYQAFISEKEASA